MNYSDSPMLVIPTLLESKGILNGPSDLAFPHALCGAGLVAASANCARLLVSQKPSAILLLGICGAYESSGLRAGALVRVDSCILGDLGARDAEGHFLPAETLGFGGDVWDAASIEAFPENLPGLRERLFSLRGVRSASVQCACGTDSEAAERVLRTGAAIEEMEGAGVHAIAHAFGVPVFHVRAVSNRAGRRDQLQWDIPLALRSLGQWLRGDE